MELDDGIVFICELNNEAEPGDMPQQKLQKLARHWYGERTIGMRRQYLAKGANEQVDLLIRIHYEKAARIGRYAMLGNGEQFRITNVSTILDDGTGLRYTELTLMRLEDFYDVADEVEAAP